METHTDTHRHTHTLQKKKKMFFPTLSLNLSPPRFLLWRSFSKRNRQAGGQPESWPRGPLAGETPRRGGHMAGLEIPFTFLWGFSSLDPADMRPDDTPTAQRHGRARMAAVLLKLPSKGTCWGLAGGVRHQGSKAGPWGSSWAPSAPLLGFQDGVYFASLL